MILQSAATMLENARTAEALQGATLTYDGTAAAIKYSGVVDAIDVFNEEINSDNRHEITHAISSEFSDYYNDVGKFTVVLPMDEYNIGIVELDAVLYIVERKLAYTVEEIQFDCDDSEITLNGYSLNNKLNRRVIAATASIANVETDVYSVITANLRGLPVLLAEKKGLTETVTATEVYGDELLNCIQPILTDAEIGNRMILDYRAKTETFELYKGVDRTKGLDAVLFVQERGTAPGLVVDKDISEYKNVCYCEAQYKDGTKFVVQAGTASDAERRELWASFSGDSQQDGETNAAFQTRVKQYAALQLGSHLNRNGFSIDADGDELGTAYNVGDLVWCVSLRLGVKYKARITAAKYSQDANGSSVKLVIGDPILTVLR